MPVKLKTYREDGWVEVRHQDEGGNVAPEFFEEVIQVQLCQAKGRGQEMRHLSKLTRG